jgi:hypothetical protein
MPLILIIVGALFVVAAVRGTHSDLFTLLKSDFTGDKNFLFFVTAIFVLGALGYVAGFKPLANAFLLLVVAVIVLSNKGFFAQFTAALKSTAKTGG